MPKDMVGQPCVYGHIINEKNIAFFREHYPEVQQWKSFVPKRLLSTAASMLAHGHYPSYSVPVHDNGATAICWIYLDYRQLYPGRLVDKRLPNGTMMELEEILGISVDTQPSWYRVATR